MVDNGVKPKDVKTEKKLSEKDKKGWGFSVFFLLVIVVLIVFLAYTPLQKENRDIIVGIIGTIVGSIGSMIAIASGRDPSEVEELKDKLGKSEGDRQALIARLRDAQIQMQLLREQIFELQSAVINKLSVFQNENPVKTRDQEEIVLHKEVEDWLPIANEDKET